MVKLINYTPDPERTIALAAQICYSSVPVDELAETLTEDKVKKMVAKLISSGHHSALEHASFTFAIEGISRAASHQLVRHRIASYSQRSQRYTKNIAGKSYLPESFKGIKEAEVEYWRIVKKAEGMYERLLELGIPKEDARYILPNATTSTIMVTMNARSLLHFFKLRCCTRAQKEIRDITGEMLALVKPIAPTLFEKAGPACISVGVCREENSCGRWRSLDSD